MKIVNALAQTIGYSFIVLWIIGAFTPIKFSVSVTGPEAPSITAFSCDAGDSFWTRRKYLCSYEEWATQNQQKQPARGGD